MSEARATQAANDYAAITRARADLAAPAAAEGANELREALAATLHHQGCRDDGDGGYCGGGCVEDTDALLTGPLADLIGERDALLAKVQAVEALADDAVKDNGRTTWADAGKAIRRALGGER